MRYHLILLALGCLALPAAAQQRPLPLDSVLRAIQTRNPALRQYDYRAQAKNAAVAGANTWEPPKVSAGYWMTPYNQKPIKEMNNGQGMGMQMVSVEQMLPNPAKQRAKREYLAGQAAVAQADQAASFNQLRAQARTLYYGRVILEKKLNVLDQSQELLDFLLKIAQARYPYNQTSLPSIYQGGGIGVGSAKGGGQQRVHGKLGFGVAGHQRVQADGGLAQLAVELGVVVAVHGHPRLHLVDAGQRGLVVGVAGLGNFQQEIQ